MLSRLPTIMRYNEFQEMCHWLSRRLTKTTCGKDKVNRCTNLCQGQYIRRVCTTQQLLHLYHANNHTRFSKEPKLASVKRIMCFKTEQRLKWKTPFSYCWTQSRVPARTSSQVKSVATHQSKNKNICALWWHSNIIRYVTRLGSTNHEWGFVIVN